MSGLFDNAETFLNANSDLFEGLSEADLLIPEKMIFLKNEVVVGTVLDASIADKIGAIKLELKVETTDHAGKILEIAVFKPKAKDGKISPASKKSWVEFLLAFFTKEEILAGKVDFTKLTGQKIQFTAGEARENNGKTNQYYNNYKLVVEADAIPF